MYYRFAVLYESTVEEIDGDTAVNLRVSCIEMLALKSTGLTNVTMGLSIVGNKARILILECSPVEEKMILSKRGWQGASETGAKTRVVFCLGKRINVEGEYMCRGCSMVSFLTKSYLIMQPTCRLLTLQSRCLVDLVVDAMFITKMSCWQRPNHLATWSDITCCHTPHLIIRYNFGQLDLLSQLPLL